MHKSFLEAGTFWIFRLFLLCLIISPLLAAQSRSNLMIINEMIDSSAAMITAITEAKSISLNPVLREEYNYLRNEVAASFSKYKILANIDRGEPSIPQINYMISNVEVSYGEIFRKGFLGKYYNERGIKVEGEFSLLDLTGESPKVIKNEFNFFYRDSVRTDEINELENKVLPFTTGELPTEPFWDNLVEPVIAISATATAIILFFYIRSK
jgi:hypothetical protein